ncbi:archaellum operon transcriptional activator EarA family protein [Pyrobaculum calidifontis]|uniref:Transcriptional regulator, ArsR family n=1 Tax=Pyrobaculum calidifontis (strain DSM 21063 / JCM 11548 / VA1) TaxID=410359 RepID=A3MUH8_PYRCJ|nr:archaellum operon transcriptional activator EarA family protein [Pyrobaculum calidifontis]ABO08295.1 conserved hypothetical protein [Pyrobaculum calidifontis JCM 11548]
MALYKIARSLRRSRLRLAILKLLCEAGEPLYPALIARAVGASYENVLGALRGLGRRYRREESLLGLGLVKEVKVGGQRLYYADEEICKNLEDSLNGLL